MVVLAGAASLRFEDEPGARALRPGDCLDIAAHRRHRVEWTARRRPTVWLAVHYGRGRRDMTRIDSLDALRTRPARLRRRARLGSVPQPEEPRHGAQSPRAGELVEQFQWLTPAQADHLPPETRVEVEHEIADVLIFLVELADRLGIDPLAAAERKLALNEKKYPVEKARGQREEVRQALRVLAYRHHFHAGNFADVFKHALLVRLLPRSAAKDKPFFYSTPTPASGGTTSRTRGRRRTRSSATASRG